MWDKKGLQAFTQLRFLISTSTSKDVQFKWMTKVVRVHKRYYFWAQSHPHTNPLQNWPAGVFYDTVYGYQIL